GERHEPGIWVVQTVLNVDAALSITSLHQGIDDIEINGVMKHVCERRVTALVPKRDVNSTFVLRGDYFGRERLRVNPDVTHALTALGLTTIRRNSISPISGFTQEGAPIKRSH